METAKFVPGILLLIIGACFSRYLAFVLGVNHLLVAIAFGFLLGNTIGIPQLAENGVETHGIWLGAGIVLMGASLSLESIFDAGLNVFFIVIIISAMTLITVEILAQNVFDLSKRLGSLLAAGASICGVSAVVSVAGAIHARQEQIAYSAATILLFDALTIAVYPIIGDLLGLSGVVFGIWSGISMFSTGPVVAVGFSHSEIAGQWATITKLARNALIGLIVIGYATYYTTSEPSDSISLRAIWDEFPKFIIGFILIAVISNIGVFSNQTQETIENSYNWLFMVAFVGLGTDIKLDVLRRTGIAPVLLILGALIFTSTISLLALLLLY